MDPALLGGAVEDGPHGFAVHAPAGWEPIPDSLFQRAAFEIGREGASRGHHFEPTLLALFRHTGHGGHFAVMRYAALHTAAERDSIIQWQRDGLDHVFAGAGVRPGRFSYRGFLLDQFLAMDSQKVVFKLLVRRSKLDLYQLDYVIPRGSYEEEVRAIESSIGSLDSGPLTKRR